MPRILPPLNAVKAFDAAVRSGSISAAARELTVSQSAVSTHIRNLEDFLGVQLVVRGATGIRLTPSGEAFCDAVEPALAAVERATMEARAASQGVTVLRLSAPASFAVRWLAPRLARFQAAHPGCVVDLRIADESPDFTATTLDGALVPMSRSQARPGWRHLFDEVLVPVCRPSLIERHGIAEQSDMVRAPLINTTTRADLWSRWWAESGIDPAMLRAGEPGFGFQDFYLSIAAAMGGVGIALVPSFLVVDEIDSGTLTSPSDHPFATGHAYWLVTRPAQAPTAPLGQFLDWLNREIQPLGRMASPS